MITMPNFRRFFYNVLKYDFVAFIWKPRDNDGNQFNFTLGNFA